MHHRRKTLVRLAAPAVAAAALAAGGCGVERTLRVDTDPPGALVYLNGDEVGRTPMRKTFLWYGTYDLQLRKEGYVTRTDQAKVWAPWWQWPPFDFLAELVPLRLQDNHAVSYTLTPVDGREVEPERVVERAAEMRGMLQSSRRTRKATAAATKPSATRPAETQP